MNKGLRDQINRYLPEKVEIIRQKAHERAEKDFKTFCECIEKGEFFAVEEDQICVTAHNGILIQKKIWNDTYVKEISELFSNEDLEVIQVSSGNWALCDETSVYLKILK